MNAVASSFAQSPSFLRRTPKTASGSILLTSTSPGFIRFGSGPQFRHRVSPQTLSKTDSSSHTLSKNITFFWFCLCRTALVLNSRDHRKAEQLLSSLGQALSSKLQLQVIRRPTQSRRFSWSLPWGSFCRRYSSAILISSLQLSNNSSNSFKSTEKPSNRSTTKILPPPPFLLQQTLFSTGFLFLTSPPILLLLLPLILILNYIFVLGE